MRVLITNDDGVSSPALLRLASWALARFGGEVTVVAPEQEQSGKSQSIDFSRPIKIKHTVLAGGISAYSVDSTPADCVRFAMLELQKQGAFDLTLSGVNRGFNLGHDIAYSGTVGAVMESARFGVPAVAFSSDLGAEALEEALARLDEIWDFLSQKGRMEICRFYNVNVPRNSKELLLTRRGGPFYHDRFSYLGKDLYLQEGEPQRNESDLAFDTAAVWNGYVSITPLTADKTDLAALEQLRGL